MNKIHILFKDMGINFFFSILLIPLWTGIMWRLHILSIIRNTFIKHVWHIIPIFTTNIIVVMNDKNTSVSEVNELKV